MNTVPAVSPVIIPIVSRPFAENTYVAHMPHSSECVVVDPGFEFELVIEQITQRRLVPRAILCTHGHLDHIAGNDALKRCWPDCPIGIGKHDAYKLLDANANLSLPYGFEVLSPAADLTFVDGEIYEAAGFRFEILETPGHSAGHVIYLVRNSPGIPLVFGGDVLFSGGVGRWDTPDGNWDELECSIRTKFYRLPDETRVLPGHGEPTTVGEEKRFNPYVKA